ncbi:metal ABC transporter ATP-binding protein [Sporomusa termitida]|uniref:High-affinity zinc uptake system ATP-binding protein ZnuC n=1 Tax=Sporomusa termitida TaxID=2377 RepID=A0A517DS71_9FIRM|nr:metal ABC transporter ATP-binding protein [Sporomusa termitida]QDR80189.1 High-affinity zinc uptake system ATP-binding protein ZnuC [Sporomusa termitida]
MAEVKLHNITFGYNNSEMVLSNISFTVQQGEFVVAVGPNGAGKSTLLKIIAGLIEPAAGQVLIDNGSIRSAARQGIMAYVPQHYSQNTAAFPATVEEIVALGFVGMRGRLKAAANKQLVGQMLEMVGAEQLKGRRIGELSGGQQQRVMVARALAGEPRLLLLDEPTSGIDYAASSRIYELLGQLNSTLGITIIMVSHDIENGTRFAAKVACINRHLCFFGDSEEFRSSHASMQHLWYYSGFTG